MPNAVDARFEPLSHPWYRLTAAFVARSRLYYGVALAFDLHRRSLRRARQTVIRFMCRELKVFCGTRG